ncbi:MAG: amino acid adenylation domain-containing protein [Brasilonema angustatum HA4187-MV1]|jgi:amino acid adenylation domain-containing protein|nr:amino acid adenylation domain-containing protein [Brasilonema angustatum HA4187-MV1]
MSEPDALFGQKSNLSPAKRALFEKWMRGKFTDQGIPRRSQQNPAPLSFAQERLWFLDQLQPAQSLYNEPYAFRLKGSLKLTALTHSLNEIVQRHEILRTNFTMVDGQPFQVIAPTLALALPIVDLQLLPEDELEAEVQRLTTDEQARPFDLANDPLVRVTLLQLDEAQYVLLFTMHHIVCDQWSFGVIIQEIVAFYKAFSKGQPSPLPELPIQYADFAVWQRQWLQGEVREAQLSYWKQQLSSTPSILELPTDRPRPAVQTNRGAKQSLILSKSLTEALKILSQQEKATLFMTLLAAFGTLLYRYTGQDDILVGTTISGRNRSEIEELIGFFVNTLVMCTDLSGTPSFREILNRVREVALGAYANQDLPFEQLVEKLQPKRNLSHTPLFQVMFQLQNTPTTTLELPSLTLSPLEFDKETAKFDLTLGMVEKEQGLIGTLTYNTDLFDAATIHRMLGHFQTLLSSIVANPDQQISKLLIISEAERHQLLVEWNNTQVDYPQNESIHELFEAQVERSPDTIAVVFENQQLTYHELNQRANQLAHHLRSLGVGPEVLVGICVERSLDMVIGLLGILKAGGAYVPLDPAYPQERLAFILQDAQVSVLLTQQRLIENLPKHQTKVICLDTNWESIAQESQENLISECTTDNLAYIIYTSGSTGQPKGVLVNHANIVRLLAATQSWYHFNQQDVWTLFHSTAFDFSVWELWGALLYGGKLVVVPYWLSRSPEDFYKFLSMQQVTVLNQTPSAFRQLIQAEESLGGPNKLRLRLVIFGGEALELQSLKPWFERHGDQFPQLVNMYGITETTVHVTYRPLTIADLEVAQASVIGCPIPDLQVYLLDQYQQLVPIGVRGEMYIGGAGVARGYLNRPELTAQRFIPNCFSDKPNARLYKSGDQARYLPNGDIEYLGRIDHQVKIRGFRIELGEIEAMLVQHPAVRESVVLAQEIQPDDKYLVSYVVPSNNHTLTTSELRNFLLKQLPEYMVPSAFVMLQALPLTPNGKVDLRSLPAPENLRPELEVAYVMPQTELEQTIATIWQKALNIENIGIHDNFFELGGHSLLMVKVHSQLRETFKADVSILEMFRYPTISSLAEYLNALKNQTTSSSHKTDIQTENIEAGKAQQRKRLQKLKSIVNKKEVNES